jgi:DNA segregation ATPase FtsK/SpoIIIE-like protein
MEINKEQAIAATNQKIQDHIPLAAQFIKENPARASITSLQRRFSIGYYIAIQVMESLQAKGLVRKVALGTWEAISHDNS